MMWKHVLWVGLLAALGPAMASAQAPRLASTDWLAQHLTDGKQQIVDLREDVKAYWAGHIPGAVWVSPEVIRWPSEGVPGKLIPMEPLTKLLAALGVKADGTVIIYGEESNFKPAYLAWALDVLGHKRWAIVDGGFKKWAAEKRPVTQEYPQIKPTRRLKYSGPVGRVRITTPEVAARQADTVLLDVRAKKLYTGEEGPWIRKGHIPGAISHPWTDDITTDGVWKSQADLRAAYEAQGVTPDKLVITSCGQGQMSAHTYVTLKYLLGYPNVRNYDGSFNEWSSMPQLPVNTGETP
jgi:thiosulfate/3-mercaptopyruvate sulfurtransferase